MQARLVHTWPLIDDIDHQAQRLGLNVGDNHHIRADRRVANGIADHVFEGPVEQFAVDLRDERPGSLQPDPTLLQSGLEFGILDDGRQQADDIDLFPRQAFDIALHARQGQQFFDQ